MNNEIILKRQTPATPKETADVNQKPEKAPIVSVHNTNQPASAPPTDLSEEGRKQRMAELYRKYAPKENIPHPHTQIQQQHTQIEYTVPTTQKSNISPNIKPVTHNQQHDFNQQPVVEAKTNFPTESYDLPTKGWFYPETSPLSTGMLTFKMMSAMEEDLLTSQKLIKSGTVISELIKRLVVTPGFNIDELLLCDLNSIVVFVRRLAYGDNYGPLSFTCDDCATKSNEIIDLSIFTHNQVDLTQFQKGINSFEFELPYSKRNITFKLLTVEDSRLADRDIAAASKISGSGIVTNITSRLRYIITSIEGKNDRTTINNFIATELTSRDSISLRGYIKQISPEIDMSFNYICPTCGAESIMEVPLTAEFFWPTTGI